MNSEFPWKRLLVLAGGVLLLIVAYRWLRQPDSPRSDSTAQNTASGELPSAAIPWQTEVFEGCTVSLSPADDAPGGVRATVQGDAGGEAWRAKVLLAPIDLAAGKNYRLRFRARADRPREAQCLTTQGHAPWQGVGLSQQIQLSTDWQPFDLAFAVSENQPQGRLHFDLGRDGAGWVEFADVQWLPEGDLGWSFPFVASGELAVSSDPANGNTAGTGPTQAPPVAPEPIVDEAPLEFRGWTLAAGGEEPGEVSIERQPGALTVRTSQDAPATRPLVLISAPLPLVGGQVNAVQFRAQAPAAVPLTVSISADNGLEVGLETTVQATPEGEGAYLEFIPASQSRQGNLEFRLPAGHRGVTIADVQVQPVSQAGGVIEVPPGGDSPPSQPDIAGPAAGQVPAAGESSTAPSAPPAAPPLGPIDGWELKPGPGWTAALHSGSEPRSLRVDVAQAGEGPEWQLQLVRFGVPVEQGKRYQLQFRARADSGRSIGLALAQGAPPWEGLGAYRQISLSPEWQSFREEFTASQSDSRARLYFDLGGAAASVELADWIWSEVAP